MNRDPSALFLCWYDQLHRLQTIWKCLTLYLGVLNDVNGNMGTFSSVSRLPILLFNLILTISKVYSKADFSTVDQYLLCMDSSSAFWEHLQLVRHWLRWLRWVQLQEDSIIGSLSLHQESTRLFWVGILVPFPLHDNLLTHTDSNQDGYQFLPGWRQHQLPHS